MRTNEVIRKEFYEWLLNHDECWADSRQDVTNWWLSQRLQDIQSIKEMVEGMTETGDSAKQNYLSALEIIHKLDELMK